MTPRVPAAAGNSPFARPGLAARLWPFALVAVTAEVSLALPPGTHARPAVIVSIVLLAAVALSFLLPWWRLPSWADWATVLVPLTYTGSVLALTLAGGAVSGVGVVILVPLAWTVLFHRGWESACVVAAIVAVEAVISVTQSAGAAVTVRRVVLWALLGALIAVATHGLRDRISRSQRENAELAERLGELRLVQDRDRLAADLQGKVVQRIFAAGLSLNGARARSADPEVRRLVEASVTDLDDAIRLLRQAVFGIERRVASAGLRQRVLDVCAGLSPVPEITFAGAVDDDVPVTAGDHLLGMLPVAFGALGPRSTQTSLVVEVGDRLRVTVAGDDVCRDLIALRDMARATGASIEVEQVAGSIRLAWSVPVILS